MRFVEFMRGIFVIRPRAFEKVDKTFIISGFVHKSWLETEYGLYRISLDLVDIKGRSILGSSISIKESNKNKLSSKISNWFYFSIVFQFSSANIGFIEESEGYMNIKLESFKKQRSILVPIIVKYFEPKEKKNQKIRSRHKKMKKILNQYKKDLIIYDKEIEKLHQEQQLKIFKMIREDKQYNFIEDLSLATDIANILETAEKQFLNYPFNDQDEKERILKSKYKDAIEWRGPLLGGAAGRMGGFRFTVFSNDHGSHFHVIHQAQGINARFSFPDIKLLNYKSERSSISSRDIKRIVNYFKDYENFKRLEHEFSKRTK